MNSRSHPGGRHRRRKPAHPDPVVLHCPCCNETVIISRANLKALLAAGQAAWPGVDSLQLNIARIPEGDWVAPASQERIAEAAAAISPADAEG